ACFSARVMPPRLLRTLRRRTAHRPRRRFFPLRERRCCWGARCLTPWAGRVCRWPCWVSCCICVCGGRGETRAFYAARICLRLLDHAFSIILHVPSAQKRMLPRIG